MLGTQPVVIYDRIRDGDLRPLNRRVASCYDWADHYGVPVVDEYLEWFGDDSVIRLPQLQVALDAAAREGARLLVHSCGVLDHHHLAGPDVVRVLPTCRRRRCAGWVEGHRLG